MDSDYFGLSEARVVIGLGSRPPPPLLKQADVADMPKANFYYDYTLERLILAEGKLKEAISSKVPEVMEKKEEEDGREVSCGAGASAADLSTCFPSTSPWRRRP